MGYSICIARMNLENIKDINLITLDEWLQVIEDDKELKLMNLTEGINPITKEKILIKIPGNAMWRNPNKGYDITFYYNKGKICTDDYDEDLIRKMKQLAEKLNAKLLDEFEEEL